MQINIKENTVFSVFHPDGDIPNVSTARKPTLTEDQLWTYTTLAPT